MITLCLVLAAALVARLLVVEKEFKKDQIELWMLNCEKFGKEFADSKVKESFTWAEFFRF